MAAASVLYSELSSLRDVRSHIDASGNAQERLHYFCRHLMLPEDTAELLKFVDLSTLEERMGSTRMISRQYRSTLLSAEDGVSPSWRECSFIEGDRDKNDRLPHVIFTTKSIQAIKRRELEAQKKLQETNAELTALLSAEVQHTAIIDALSQVSH